MSATPDRRSSKSDTQVEACGKYEDATDGSKSAVQSDHRCALRSTNDSVIAELTVRELV